jgi:DNA-binding NarL/FixJ family response regulator
MLTGTTVNEASKMSDVVMGFDSPKKAGSLFATDFVTQTEDAGEISVVVIDRRQLERECFAQGLASQQPGTNVISFGSLVEWRESEAFQGEVSVILLVIGNRKVTDLGVAGDIAKAVADANPVPIIVVADTDDLSQILKALECGAKGFIPTTVGLRVASEAIALTLAGGVFVPASSVMAMRSVISSNGGSPRPLAGIFTVRQMAVVEALRRGRANKIIAHELNLRESTVKVHIRNIMKKLNATNRTEVAYKIRDMFPEQSGPEI